MGDEGHTGVNGKARNRDGTWGTAIAISPFSDPRQSPLISHGTLSSTSLGRGFRNLILVLRVATIGQMELDLEIKYICNIWFKRKINSEKKKRLWQYTFHSQSLSMSVKLGEKEPSWFFKPIWFTDTIDGFSLRMPYQNIKGEGLSSPCLHVDGLGNCIKLEPHPA